MIRRFILGVIGWLYVYLAKPILFLFSPDRVHKAMIRFAGFVSYHPISRGFVRVVFKRRPNARLTQTIRGIKFSNPVGLSAGFDKNGEIMPAIASLGFGFGTVGSVTAHRCEGNPRPWFYRLPKSKSTVVYVGLANHGSDKVLKRIRHYPPDAIHDFPVNLSVAKTNNKEVVDTETAIDDYVTSLKRAQNVQAISMFEINISCPNAYGGEPFSSPERLEKLLTAIDKLNITRPIFIKMPIDQPWDKFKLLLEVAVRHDVAGVTIGNLLKDRKLAVLDDDLPDSVRGNLSGKPTWEASNELIRQTYLNYSNKLTIIGAGGVFSAKDAYAKIRLGASLIDIITGLIFNGPQLVAQINDGLTRLLKRDGYDNISQAIGIDTRKN